MAKDDKKIETVLILSNKAGADSKRRRFKGMLKNTAKIKIDPTAKVYDMRSRRLVQRLRDEVLDQLMNPDIKPQS